MDEIELSRKIYLFRHNSRPSIRQCVVYLLWDFQLKNNHRRESFRLFVHKKNFRIEMDRQHFLQPLSERSDLVVYRYKEERSATFVAFFLSSCSVRATFFPILSLSFFLDVFFYYFSFWSELRGTKRSLSATSCPLQKYQFCRAAIMCGSKTVNRSLHGGPIAIITFHDFIGSDLDVNYAQA